MSKPALQDRPTFKVAFLYRSHGLISRDTFLAFQKVFDGIVNQIVNCSNEAALWEYVRSLFDFDDYADTVPINAANLSIVFNSVQHFMNYLALDWNRDISYQKRFKPFVYTIQAARAIIASQLNVEPALVAIMRNGSDPNGVITNGMDFAKDEEVLVWDENHPTLDAVAWNIRKLRFDNINIVSVCLEGERDEEKIIDTFVSKLTPLTKLVAISEISYLTGTRLPVKRLIQKIREMNYKVHVHLDGAQAWGALKHDLKDIDCDSYSAGAHKWFLGPKETGILYMKKECVPHFWPKDIGYNGEMQGPPDVSEEAGESLPDDASRFEMIGQRNDTNLIGLLYTADLLDLIGFDKIEKRIKSLASQMMEGLAEVAEEYDDIFIIETPAESNLYHNIIIIQFKEETPKGQKPLNEEIFDRLYENHNIGVSFNKKNRVRFSPHIYNTEGHIDRAIHAIRCELGQIMKERKKHYQAQQ